MRLQRTLATAAGIGLIAVASSAAAQEAASPISVTTAAVGTGVEDRELVGAAETFVADVGTVYFYTTLEGDFPEAQVAHVWKRGGEEMARVNLNARGPRWRTWSSKRIPAEWGGDWTVEVQDAAGNVLSTVSFRVGS